MFTYKTHLLTIFLNFAPFLILPSNNPNLDQDIHRYLSTIDLLSQREDAIKSKKKELSLIDCELYSKRREISSKEDKISLKTREILEKKEILSKKQSDCNYQQSVATIFYFLIIGMNFLYPTEENTTWLETVLITLPCSTLLTYPFLLDKTLLAKEKELLTEEKAVFTEEKKSLRTAREVFKKEQEVFKEQKQALREELKLNTEKRFLQSELAKTIAISNEAKKQK